MIEYCTATNITGPWTYQGIIQENVNNSFTTHPGIIDYKGKSYFFYHNGSLPTGGSYRRSVCVDYMYYNEDGTIQKVIPTLRGVGVTAANKQIQIDRYTQLSEQGTSIAFLDTLNTFKGWKTIFNGAGAWLQYNSVDFGSKPLKTVSVNAISTDGGVLQLRANSITGPVIAELRIAKSNEWKLTKATVLKTQTGVQNLFVVSKDGKQVEVDWISFE